MSDFFDNEKFESCKTNKDWDFGNSVLYSLCETSRKHVKEEEIIAKIWLVGRAYSASLERSKSSNDKKKLETNEFYPTAARKIKEKLNKNNEFDNDIKDITSEKKLDLRTLKKIITLHKKFLDFLKEENITNKKPVSFVSKYLHFHTKNTPIYDKFAREALNYKEIRKEIKLKVDEIKNEIIKEKIPHDKNYLDFCAKFLAVYQHIEEKNPNLTVRMVDNYLCKAK